MAKSKLAPPASRAESGSPGAGWSQGILRILDRRSGWLAVLFVAIATARIAAVYPVYNHTIDEPAHIACGMEWLDKGTYRLEDQHPPLSRVASALGPRLAGAHAWGRNTIYNEGAAILYDGRFEAGRYQQLLSLARAGILPFFWLACGAVFWWTWRGVGSVEAVCAVLLLSLTPPVLAHAGLATTDMAVTAGVAATVFSLQFWLKAPDWRSALLLAAAVAIAVLSKFSSLVFLPAFAAAFIALLWSGGERPRFHWPSLGLAALAGALLIWGGYRFSFGPGPWGFPVPAPELFSGIHTVREHNRMGHPSYLFGELNQTGWGHYYLVVLAVKTPLPLLALAAYGAWLAWQRRVAAGIAALALIAGVLAVAPFSSINIGVRHILPVYLGFSVLGALALTELLRSRLDWAGGAQMLLLAAGGATAHPDYLPYFNVLAGGEPEKILADSDLDWGQDMNRLAGRLHELGAQQVAFNPFISAHLERVHGFPRIVPSDPFNPEPGWNAISITPWKVARMGLGTDFAQTPLWPDRFQPSERVGQGVFLYYFPPRLFTQQPR